jgi:hypothetical protein
MPTDLGLTQAELDAMFGPAPDAKAPPTAQEKADAFNTAVAQGKASDLSAMMATPVGKTQAQEAQLAQMQQSQMMAMVDTAITQNAMQAVEDMGPAPDPQASVAQAVADEEAAALAEAVGYGEDAQDSPGAPAAAPDSGAPGFGQTGGIGSDAAASESASAAAAAASATAAANEAAGAANEGSQGGTEGGVGAGQGASEGGGLGGIGSF